MSLTGNFRLLAILGCLNLPVWASETRLVAPPAPGSPVAVLNSPYGILVASERGLFRFGPDGWHSVLPSGPESSGSDPWIATSRALDRWPERSSEPCPLGFSLSAGIRAFASDPHGGLWLGTRQGLYPRASWQQSWRRNLVLPAGPVDFIEVSRGDSSARSADEIWVAAAGSLWRGGSDREFVRWRAALDDGWWQLPAVLQHESGRILVVPSGVWVLEGRALHERVRRLALGVGGLRDAVLVDENLVLASRRGASWLPLASLSHAQGELLIEREAPGSESGRARASGGDFERYLRNPDSAAGGPRFPNRPAVPSQLYREPCAAPCSNTSSWTRG